jgi:phage terminase Nu1 subunit (DNA packaging protein)
MRLTISQVTAHYGVDRRTITNWINSDPPCPSEMRAGRRYFDSVAVAEWREDRVRALAERAAQSTDFLEARSRKMVADAAMAELELAKAKGELVSVAVYREEVTHIATSIRAQLLSIPGRYAVRTLGHTSLAESTRAWDNAIRDVLGELAAGESPGVPPRRATPHLIVE